MTNQEKFQDCLIVTGFTAVYVLAIYYILTYILFIMQAKPSPIFDYMDFIFLFVLMLLPCITLMAETILIALNFIKIEESFMFKIYYPSEDFYP